MTTFVRADAVDTSPTAARAKALAARYDALDAEALLAALAVHEVPGRIALVSSFGAEAAILLHLCARIDPAFPVVFIDSGRLFVETLRYRDELVARLGLTDVRSVGPEPAAVALADPDDDLWARHADGCCGLRKVVPLQRALAPFAAWVTGRKRYHGAERQHLPKIEPADGRIKVNPLADWTRNDVEAYLTRHGLPRHPLVAAGFSSIGCVPCTDRVVPGEAARSGRWRGGAKTECGIHLRLRDEAAAAAS